LATTPELWRTFCAIALPAPACQQANEHIRKLKDQFPDVRVRWTRDEKFHLTVKFLGEIPEERVGKLSRAATRVTGSLSPFKLVIAGAGAFPPGRPPKVLWLGVTDQEGGLAALHSSLDDECAQEGFAKEQRPFQPHLTLARPREPKGARALASLHKDLNFVAIEIAVSELLVIRSELSSNGSNYTVVSRHPLTGSALTGAR
jgi:2'-5' RNA ligase